jgi:hypothetical protein
MDKEMIYTAKEVFRTAHPYVYTNKDSYGEGLVHGINQVCRCCKSADTSKITNKADLKPWLDFYTSKEFAAYECNSCGYKFSWYKDKQ